MAYIKYYIRCFKILSFNNKPAEILSAFTSELKKRDVIFNGIQLENNKLQKGDIVKMYTGPFTYFFLKLKM